MIYINACSAIIPGLDQGTKFGSLIPTQDILEQIKIEPSDDFSNDFIAKRLGIETVARSNSSIEAISAALKDPRSSKKQYSLNHENSDLKEMTCQVIRECLPADDDKEKVIAHIHVTGTAMPNHGHFLSECRKLVNVSEGNYIPTIFHIKGCSGIYDAIISAEGYLARMRKEAIVLVTSDSNLLPFVGQASIRHAHVKNINEWLYPVIFAEGVGCIALSNSLKKDRVSLRFESSKIQMVTQENRVRVTTIKNELACFVSAKEVSATYQAGMSFNLSEAKKKIRNDFKDVHAVLIHESNPNLLDLIVKKYEIPPHLVPKFSDKIGTLGPVSSFQLIETVFKQNIGVNKDVILCVIGELFSGVNAGIMMFKSA